MEWQREKIIREIREYLRENGIRWAIVFAEVSTLPSSLPRAQQTEEKRDLSHSIAHTHQIDHRHVQYQCRSIGGSTDVRFSSSKIIPQRVEWRSNEIRQTDSRGWLCRGISRIISETSESVVVAVDRSTYLYCHRSSNGQNNGSSDLRSIYGWTYRSLLSMDIVQFRFETKFCSFSLFVTSRLWIGKLDWSPAKQPYARSSGFLKNIDHFLTENTPTLISFLFTSMLSFKSPMLPFSHIQPARTLLPNPAQSPSSCTCPCHYPVSSPMQIIPVVSVTDGMYCTCSAQWGRALNK